MPRGAPAFAARAAGVAPNDPTAVADEIQRAVNHASPADRDVLEKLPAPSRSAGMLGALVDDLQTKVMERG